ncbi:MAG: hypothetical protein RR389_01045, partial [Christensenella sp.]
MPEITVKGAEELINRLHKLYDNYPDKLRVLHERIRNDLLKHVRSQYPERFHGKVAKWQEGYVGSNGGYAAIRPTKKSMTVNSVVSGNPLVYPASGDGSPGAVTAAIEFGYEHYFMGKPFRSPNPHKRFQSGKKLQKYTSHGIYLGHRLGRGVYSQSKITAELI